MIFVVRISFIGIHDPRVIYKEKIGRSKSMKTFLMPIVLSASLVLVSVAELAFVGDAEAIIGLPRTPLSVAGVARRSMYREAAVVSTVAVTSAAAANAAAAQAAAANTAAAQAAAGLPVGTMVPSLPPGCTSTVISGVNYFNCNGIYYRAGFQGNNVVYIVSAP
jgi:hypothetical protein